MTLIDGRPLAAEIRARSAVEVAALGERGIVPTLAAIVATDDEPTAWYLRSLARSAAETGIALRELRLDQQDAAGVPAALDRLSADETVDGIICLTPLPEGLDLAAAAEHIRPSKDVDGANPLSLGRLLAGRPAFAPATAQAVLEILHASGTVLSGVEAVVVGRSIVVGKPLALLLLAEQATVTVCHSRTRELAGVTRRAAVIVAAVGQARLIGAEHVREGAVVIDVGTNPTDDGGLVGDVDTAAVERAGAAVTPVPGGVGPVTSAVLLRNVVTASRERADGRR
jgi:methylenetetrahydrofolate dehydrogenase (NADP+)/methenyltetrahydrofolate cyclohydrolase